MSEFTRNSKYDGKYSRCIYFGISEIIEFEIKNGWRDKREELKYLVDRYNEEEIASGYFLREKLAEYNKIAEEKYGKLKD